MCTALIRILWWRGVRWVCRLVLYVQAGAGPYLETPPNLLTFCMGLWLSGRGKGKMNFPLAPRVKNSHSPYTPWAGRREDASKKSGAEVLGYAPTYIHRFIYVEVKAISLDLFASACLSHSVQLEFSISVQPDFAAPLSLCKPQARYPSFMLLHVFHMK